MGDCYYDLLGVERTASTEDIKKAFRAKAKLYHPDLNPAGGKAGEQKFKQLTEAHEVLQNPFKRSQYDSVSDMGRFTERSHSKGMTMDEYMEQHIKFWRDGRRSEYGAQQARRSEAEERWRQMQAESWEWEKRDAKIRQTQFQGQHERVQTERQKRSTRILQRFWQTHRGVVWQDVAFMTCIGVAACVTASYWKAYLVAREERLGARPEATAR